MTRRSSLLVALIVGCRPAPGNIERSYCDPRQLDPGEVRARLIPCDDELIDEGDGRTNDYLIENELVRFVIKDPAESLTTPGAPGAGVIDAAPYGKSDMLTELLPLDWEGSSQVELLNEEGSSSIVLDDLTYRLEAGASALEITGSSALWIYPRAGAELVGGTLHSSGLVLGADGSPADLGGAVLFSAGSKLAVGSASEVHEALWPDGPELSGESSGDWIELFEGEQLRGRLPVSGGEFLGSAPAGVDGIRAAALGYSPGPLTDPSSDAVDLGELGALFVRVSDNNGQDIPALVTVDGSKRAVPAGGAELLLGAGTFELCVSAGALTEHWCDSHELAGEQILELTLGRRINDHRVATRLAEPDAWPSALSRIPASEAAAQAAAEGIALVVLAPPDEVGVPELERPWSELVFAQGGSWIAADLGSVLAWPWTSNSKKPAHSAVDWEGYSPEDLIQLAAGGQKKNRIVAADMAWFESAGPPLGWDPAPDLAWLSSLDDLEAYLELLDLWVNVGVMGPLTYVTVEDPSSSSVSELERSLLLQQSTASSGPDLLLSVDRSELDWSSDVTLEHVSPPGAECRVKLWVDGELAEESAGVISRSVRGTYVLGSADCGVDPLTGQELWAVSSVSWLGSPSDLRPILDIW